MLRILIGHNRYRISGGDDRVAWESASILEKKGHCVIPFAMAHANNWESSYGEYFVSGINYGDVRFTISNLKTAVRMIHSFESSKKIGLLIGKVRPDVVHVHNIYGRITPSILPVVKQQGIPVVMTLHDYKLICPSYSMVNNGVVCERCKGGRYYEAIKTRCHKDSYLASSLYSIEAIVHKFIKIYERNVDYFITPSKFMMNKMIEFGMPADKFVHIPNFIDVGTYIPKYGGSDYILYSGRLSREKGIYTLLKAMMRVKSAQLAIAGDGRLRKDLEIFVATYRIENVQFLGHLSGSTLANTLRNSNFVIVPSEWYENCPMAILEAFAYGKPVIGARIGGIPELIDDGVDGLLFDSGNVDDLRSKIEGLLCDPAKVAKMGRQARKKVEARYNSGIYYHRLISVYEMAISKVKNKRM
jgi:glycosyltransferase involved in cell wall biosynthesis